jgi:hypothetical protein
MACRVAGEKARGSEAKHSQCASPHRSRQKAYFTTSNNECQSNTGDEGAGAMMDGKMDTDFGAYPQTVRAAVMDRFSIALAFAGPALYRRKA